MDFFELIQKRESCRNYAARRPEKEQLMRCVEAARVAPSACNSQPWSFVVVNSEQRSAQVAKCLQDLGMNKFTDGCPAFIVVCEEAANLSAKLGARLKKQQYAQMDIGIATAHLCFAATEQGLSTCIIGWFHEEKLKEVLGLDPKKRVRLVVAVGFAAEQTLRPKKRKTVEEIVQYLE